MATINQSPSGQTSVGLSSIDFTDITATASPFWRGIKIVGSPSAAMSIDFTDITATASPFWKSIKIVGSPSVAVNIGGGGPSIPTVGQIWPLGTIPYV